VSDDMQLEGYEIEMLMYVPRVRYSGLFVALESNTQAILQVA
jgi:hypothetical protein